MLVRALPRMLAEESDDDDDGTGLTREEVDGIGSLQVEVDGIGSGQVEVDGIGSGQVEVDGIGFGQVEVDRIGSGQVEGSVVAVSCFRSRSSVSKILNSAARDSWLTSAAKCAEFDTKEVTVRPVRSQHFASSSPRRGMPNL